MPTLNPTKGEPAWKADIRGIAGMGQATQGEPARVLPSRRGDTMWKTENPRGKFREITGMGHATQGKATREIQVAKASQREKV